MCEVSDKIKFCTCSSDVENLKHYWVLHRKSAYSDVIEICVGTYMMPNEKAMEFLEINTTTLIKRLNEADAFDIVLELKNKDILEVVINNKTEKYEDRITYAFEYKKGKWKSIEYDFFELMNEFEETNSGKMKNVLKKKR
jgi:hypothetical protein